MCQRYIHCYPWNTWLVWLVNLIWVFWYHQNQQGFNNLPFLHDDKTPYLKIQGKIQFNFKTPPKYMHNEKMKIWAEFPLKFKKIPWNILINKINNQFMKTFKENINIQTSILSNIHNINIKKIHNPQQNNPQQKNIIWSIRTHLLPLCHYQKERDKGIEQ